MSPPNDRPGPVLFFDGECGLCQGVVRFLLWLDRHARLRFARLQDPAAQAYLRAQGLPTREFDTLVFVPDWARRERPEFLLRTAGVIAALRGAGGIGPAIAWFMALVPAGGRDAAYRAVARWRHRIFGAGTARPFSRPDWAGRFLDSLE